MDYDYSGNGRKGGLCMLWIDYLSVDLNLTLFSLHHIDVVVDEADQK